MSESFMVFQRSPEFAKMARRMAWYLPVFMFMQYLFLDAFAPSRNAGPLPSVGELASFGLLAALLGLSFSWGMRISGRLHFSVDDAGVVLKVPIGPDRRVDWTEVRRVHITYDGHGAILAIRLNPLSFGNMTFAEFDGLPRLLAIIKQRCPDARITRSPGVSMRSHAAIVAMMMIGFVLFNATLALAVYV